MSETVFQPIQGTPQVPGPEATELERRFLELASAWTRETAHQSSTRQMADHPAYLEIVRMGPKVVALIFKELERNPGFHWFHALRDIIGSGPEIPAAARGKLRPVTDAWLRWGKEHGICW
jgi:hypothetical protein